MLKPYFHKKELNIPLYCGVFVIIFSNDAEKIKKYIPDYDSNDYAVSWDDGNNNTFVAFNFDHPRSKNTYGNISHEATHAVNFILDDRGVKSSFSNDEPIAYLMNWCVDEIHKFARDKKMKIHYAE